jgi:hypothetical protein
MIHEQIFFEGAENSLVKCKSVFNLLNLRDIRNVGDNQWWSFPIDYFKGGHASGGMVKYVVPPFS